MKALVTGSDSFIGSCLVEELNTLGFEVRALLWKGAAPTYLEGLEYQRLDGDITDFDSLCRALKGVDYVFHLAEVTQARQRAVLYEYNALGTDRLGQAVLKADPPLNRLVYLSSLAAAGPSLSLRPRTELEKDHPLTQYGKSKLQAEKELQKYRSLFPVSIVRTPMVYGPRDQTIMYVIETVTRNLAPILKGSTREGHKYFSAIYVKDLCRGLVQAALVSKEKAPSGELFYLSGDDICTYQDLMATIAEKLNCDPFKVQVPKFAVRVLAMGLSMAEVFTRRSLPFNMEKLKELMPDYWICSNQKAKKILGFSPEFDLSSGVSHVIEWYKRHKWI